MLARFLGCTDHQAQEKQEGWAGVGVMMPALSFLESLPPGGFSEAQEAGVVKSLSCSFPTLDKLHWDVLQ